MSQPIINPYLAVLLGVLAAAFSSIFTKAAEAPPLIIALYRMAFTVLLLAPVTLATGRRELRALTRRDVLPACGAGIMLTLHFATWVTSLNYTSIASSTVLVTMQPLFVITGGYLFYKEKITRRGLLGAAIALSGSVLVGISDFRVGGQALWGDFLAFSGAFFVAGYMLVGRGIRERLSLLPYITMVYGSSMLTLFLAAVMLQLPLVPYPPGTWLMFVLLAAVPTVMGHTVFNWALRYVKAAVVSVSILGESVGATILAYFIFHQVPTLLQVTGGLIIITGLMVFIRSTAQSDN
ncbi:DMT family transporter [Desulfoscipio sp. XC116]|uniref:DMT family transporter n=1 Tax=Desulfoscipio sp. XC116 TaxID=3144975 RepID=UPI00325A9F84